MAWRGCLKREMQGGSPSRVMTRHPPASAFWVRNNPDQAGSHWLHRAAPLFNVNAHALIPADWSGPTVRLLPSLLSIVVSGADVESRCMARPPALGASTSTVPGVAGHVVSWCAARDPWQAPDPPDPWPAPFSLLCDRRQPTATEIPERSKRAFRSIENQKNKDPGISWDFCGCGKSECRPFSESCPSRGR